MKCFSCGRPTIVIDTRERSYGVRRRRECPSCSARFTTVESVIVTIPRRSAAAYERRST